MVLCPTKKFTQAHTHAHTCVQTHMHGYACICTHTHTQQGWESQSMGLLKLFQRSKCLQELCSADNSYCLEESLFRAFQWEIIAAPLSSCLEQWEKRSCNRISRGKTAPRHGMQPVRMLQTSPVLWFSGLRPISCRLLTSDDQQTTQSTLPGKETYFFDLSRQTHQLHDLKNSFGLFNCHNYLKHDIKL